MKVERKIRTSLFTKFMEDNDFTLVLSEHSVCEIDYIKVEIKELGVHELGLTEPEAIANLINLIAGKVFSFNGNTVKVPIFEAEKDEG